MDRFELRLKLLVVLEERRLLRGTSDHAMSVPLCSRSGDVVEPLLRPQWFVRMGPMAARAVQAVETGRLSIAPAHFKTVWFDWLRHIQDWCVSRQLWWGHRIPAYYVTVKGVRQEEAIVAASLEDAMAQAVAKYECASSDIKLEQDEDVLDTWFSSGLFPFSCLGWPDAKSADLQAWHPTTLLETGQDILFFWVARMVMCSLQLTDKLPFTEVYLHSMVRDKYGRKMSKSLGNVIDPLEVIEVLGLAWMEAEEPSSVRLESQSRTSS